MDELRTRVLPGKGVIAPATPTSSIAASTYRIDIQGLRAVAVLLVVLFHAHAPWLSGGYVGVDVFFVISGFLITGGLVEEAMSSGRLSLPGFYARRARRILPAAAVALAGVGVMTWVLLPPIRRAGVGWDAVMSALYLENWRLAVTSTDYLRGTQAPSPLQHYWSLAVEEQFYILWPAVLLATLMFVRRRSHSGRITSGALLVPATLITIASLIYSIVLTNRSPGSAYFVTTTRLWELALGGLLAIVLSGGRSFPRAIAIPLGWAGLAAIIWSAIKIDAQTPFPGIAALAPTLGAAAVIAAGTARDSRAGPVLILGMRPATWIGDLSYSYYLWHWPLLVVVAGQREGALSFLTGVIVVVVALIPSWLSLKLVERPVLLSTQLKERSRALAMGASITMVGVAVGVAMILSVWPPPSPTQGPVVMGEGPNDTGGARKFGAEVLSRQPRNDPAGRPRDEVNEIFPEVDAAHTDIGGCSASLDESALKSCHYGDEGGSARIALVGDSHAAQWAPALNIAGEDHGWNITEYTKQNCPLAEASTVVEGRLDTTCADWNVRVMNRLLAEPPDLLLVSNIDRTMMINGSVVSKEAGVNALATGLQRSWRRLLDQGVTIAALRDTPRPDIDVPDCLSANPKQMSKCAVPRSAANANGFAIRKAAERSNVPLIDLNNAICPTSKCAPVIGKYIVYADTNHITATYAASLSTRVGRVLARLTPDAG